MPHGPKHWDQVLSREFKGESDRACVILAAALLDGALETLLKTYLLPSTQSEDALFEGGNAPLSSFSARIEVSYRLGLLDAPAARALHLIRRIRNDFAHNVTGCTFADSAVANRLTELRRVSGLPENAKDIRSVFPEGARGDFQIIVSRFQWALRDLAEHIRPLRCPSVIDGYFPESSAHNDAPVAAPQG